MCNCRNLDSKEILCRALMIGIPVLILLAIIGGLLGGSVKDLYPTNYGLQVNGNTNTIDYDQIYDSGRYFIGLNHYFIQYSKQRKSIVYSSNYNENKKNIDDPQTAIVPQVKIRSKQGLSLSVGVALHYSFATDRSSQDVLKTQMIQTYKNYGTNNFQDFLVNIGRASIMDACSHFTAQQFYSNRKALSYAIFDQASKDFADHYFNLHSALLIQVIISQSFDTAIQATEIKKQEKESKLFEKASLEVKLGTNEKLAEQDKVINVEKSYSLGFDKKTALQSQASVLQIKTDQQKTILTQIKGATTFNFSDQVGLSANDKLLTYYWIKMLNNHKAKKLLITQKFSFA